MPGFLAVGLSHSNLIAQSNHSAGAGGPKRIAIVGSTGTIGVNCLDVAAHLPERLQVAGISGHSNTRVLKEQAEKHRPDWVAVTDVVAAAGLKQGDLPSGCELVVGQDALARKVAGPGHELVVSAIVGAAGLDSTWAALEAGKDVAVANKETLVLAGALVLDLAKRRNAKLLPVDSEHSALFQLLQEPGALGRVEKLVLTGSGGPFRGRKRCELAEVTVEQALAHPTWRMGKKITIDSATLMNKALELIEARWLFDMPVNRLDAIIHPESVIHSFVEFVDGSVVAQAFPALDLGLAVAQAGGTAGAVLNAANEVAVERFLAGSLKFLDITQLVVEVVGAHTHDASPALNDLRRADGWARKEAVLWQNNQTTTAN